MAPDFLTRSGPPELILDILDRCESIQDVLSFTATCRRLHHIWQAGAASVLWPASLRKDPEFDGALIASRLTTLVHQAEARGELPPRALSPGDFSGHRQAPTVPEIKAATTFGRFVDFLAVNANSRNIDAPDDYADNGGPEDPARMPEWEARVRKALYRLFTCAAALAGAYQKPFFKARASGDPVIKNLVHRFHNKQDRYLVGLSDHELDFLERFTVCNMRASLEAEEAVFGPLCDWLLHSIMSDSESRQAYAERFEKGFGRALCCPNIKGSGPCPYPEELARGDGSHSDSHPVVWEISKMIWLDHYLAEEATPWFHCRCHSAAERISGFGKPLLAVFFGVFRAEEAVFEQTEKCCPAIATDLAVSQEGDHIEPPPENPDLLRERFNLSFRDNTYTKPGVALFFDEIFSKYEYNPCKPKRNPKRTTSVAPLRFKFFDFFFRRTTGLRATVRYTHGGLDFGYGTIVGNYGILAHDDVEGREATLDESGFNDGSVFIYAMGGVPQQTRWWQ
ncbi:hypothetical protein RB595_005103 [Gaeumannomyces hyphopodioides]